MMKWISELFALCRDARARNEPVRMLIGEGVIRIRVMDTLKPRVFTMNYREPEEADMAAHDDCVAVLTKNA